MTINHDSTEAGNPPGPEARSPLGVAAGFDEEPTTTLQAPGHSSAESGGFGGETDSELDRLRLENRRLSAALRELGTPVLPIHDGILVLPLIGHMDSLRGAHLTDDLLAAIERHQAAIIILDITGVSVVDTAVANMLIQATRAAALLGTRCILAGVSGAVSRTLVQLGIELRQLVSRRDLQDAIAYALRSVGHAIVRTREDIDWLTECTEPETQSAGT